MTNQILQPDSIKPSILLVGDGGVSENVRAALPGKALAKRGWKVLAGRYDAIQKEEITQDVAVLSRIANPATIRWLRNAHIRVIMDVDDDFYAIPKGHPGYSAVGAGNPRYLENLSECLRMADLVTVTTPELSERLRVYNPRVHLIPNGWDADNPFWGLKYYHPNTVNIGWAGTITHREDFLLVKSALIKLAKKFSWIKVFIGGDPEIYQMLSGLPEIQKQFIPMVPFHFYPHTLSYLDLWLAPLLNTPFNQAKSDIKLVDAGASRTCFAASVISNYERWSSGGVLIAQECDWFESLEWLTRDPMARKMMAQSGWERAQEREINQLAPIWEYALEEALA